MPQLRINGVYPRVNVTQGSATVTILGVNADTLRAGHLFKVDETADPWYELAGSATFDGTNSTVSLTAPYAGTTGSNVVGLFQSEFTEQLALPLPDYRDLGVHASLRKAFTAIDQYAAARSAQIPIENVASAPAAPSAGGILYVEAGALKYIGSNGTVTVLAPA